MRRERERETGVPLLLRAVCVLTCLFSWVTEEIDNKRENRERESDRERERERGWTAYEELSELTLCRLPSLESLEVCRTNRPAAATAPPGPPWCITCGG